MMVKSGMFSHYTFRPVSPNLSETDIEEMGHILIDPKDTKGLPGGNLFSGFLPYHLAWHAFINIYKGSRVNQYALTGINLSSSINTASGQEPAMYRHATYISRDKAGISWFKAPVYVKRKDLKENRIKIPAGTVYKETNALLFTPWDNEQWAQQVEQTGRILNSRLDISDHPRFLDGPVPGPVLELLPYGKRQDAYLRAGIR
jgi:hypothetical protein